MWQALFWLFLINAVLLINHEIESAYWREWEMFRLPGGISGFLMLHFPLLFVILYGVALVYRQTLANAETLNYRTRSLESVRDVDTLQDLEHYPELLALIASS